MRRVWRVPARGDVSVSAPSLAADCFIQPPNCPALCTTTPTPPPSTPLLRMHARSRHLLRALSALTPANPSQLPIVDAPLRTHPAVPASLSSPAAAAAASKLCCVLRRGHTTAGSMGDTPPALPTLAEGPYVYNVLHDHVESTRQVQGDRQRPVKLPLFLTLPMAPSPDSAAPPGPFPVCILLNGFQARASYYAPLARRLASWGVAVLQYNAPALTIIPDAAELPFLPVVVDWLKHAAASESAQHAALQGRVDLDRLVVAGHSRGGKLAALHYAKGSVSGLPIRTAFLIDPVDNTSFTAESAEYPSAHKALKAAGKPFALAAAGLVGSSNPEGSNWRVFQAVQPAGSWALELKQAGHTTFMKPPTGVETWLLDRVFGGGRMSRDLAISQTAAAMLAWFQQQLAPPATSGSSSSTAVAAAASASHMPLAAAGLNAAAAALTLAPPAPGATTGSSESPAAPFGSQLLSSFKQWVTSPLVAGELEFFVKGAEGGAAAATDGRVE